MTEPRFGRPVLAAVLALTMAGCAATRQQPAPPPAPALSRLLDAQLADLRLSGCQVGLAVYSLDRRQWLYEHGADRLFVPASNVKLVTAAAALHGLGPHYQPETVVRFAGQRAKGHWQGALDLVGGGDPLLSVGDLETLVGQLRRQGLQRFTGTVAGDGSRFDAVRWGKGWMWDDMGTDDAPAVSALTVNLNRLTLLIRPAGLRQPLAIERRPMTAFVRLQNQTDCQVAGEPLRVHYRPIEAPTAITVTGSLPPDGEPTPVAVTLADPVGYAASVFAETMGRQGIPLQIRLGDGAGGGAVVARHQGAPVTVAVTRLNKDSVNLVGEMLLKQVGAATGGLPGTADKGLAFTEQLLVQAGWEPNTYRLVDGSGLSRYNLLSPRHLVRLLDWMNDAGPLRQPFRDSLPVGGGDGTLASRFQGLHGAERIRAKTGTMSGISALSGYVESASGEQLAFSCLINGAPGAVTPLRQVQDEILARLTAWRR